MFDAAAECRPFLPSRDLARSRDFYRALGFDILLDGDVVIVDSGTGSFIVQARFVEAWAGNCMMQLMVDDLDAWWTRIQSLDLPGRFGVQPPRAPAVQPWGLRVAFVFDPAGVLWHVAERRPAAPQDQRPRLR